MELHLAYNCITDAAVDKFVKVLTDGALHVVLQMYLRTFPERQLQIHAEYI